MSSGGRVKLECGTGWLHPQQWPAPAGHVEKSPRDVPGRAAAVRNICRVLRCCRLVFVFFVYFRVCGWAYQIWLNVERVRRKGHVDQGSFRAGMPFLFFFWSPERRSGPFRHIAAKFRFHLNESDKFALFGSKMPSPPWPGALPLHPTKGTAPRPPYRLALPRSPYS